MLAEKRLTQEWLSEASGIPMRTLARRLHTRHPSPLSLEELADIAHAFDMRLIDLLPETATRRSRGAVAEVERGAVARTGS